MELVDSSRVNEGVSLLEECCWGIRFASTVYAREKVETNKAGAKEEDYC